MVSALALLVGLLAVPVILSITNPRAGIAWFLAVAPAVPVAGAVLAYRVASDPAGEIAVASPLHTFRIVVMRTAVVLAAALPIGLLTSVLLPLPTSRLLGWLLPGLALCAVVLAAGTRFDPAKVGAGSDRRLGRVRDRPASTVNDVCRSPMRCATWRSTGRHCR